MPDVERRGRLVEEHDRSPLSECARDDDALLLAARERAEEPVAVVEEVHPRERLPRDLPVPEPLLREAAEVRRAAEEDVLRDRHPRRRRRLLRQDGDETRDLDAAERARRAALEGDRARERHEPGDRAQQRRLPRSVRADEREPLSLRHLEVDSVDDRPAAELDRHAVEPDHEAPPRVDLSTKAKKGAPTNAVTMPSGSSAGARAVRAITSASTRKPAPPSSDSGRSVR